MIYSVKMPILGFENIKEFLFEELDDFFVTIKESVGMNPITFTLVNPYSLTEYNIVIPDSAMEKLEINENSNILIYNPLVLKEPLINSSVNLLAPIIFNKDNLTMGQIPLCNMEYSQYKYLEKLEKFWNF